MRFNWRASGIKTSAPFFLNFQIWQLLSTNNKSIWLQKYSLVFPLQQFLFVCSNFANFQCLDTKLYGLISGKIVQNSASWHEWRFCYNYRSKNLFTIYNQSSKSPYHAKDQIQDGICARLAAVKLHSDALFASGAPKLQKLQRHPCCCCPNKTIKPHLTSCYRP